MAAATASRRGEIPEFVPPAEAEAPEDARARLKAELLGIMDARDRIEHEMDVLLEALGTEGLDSALIDGEHAHHCPHDLVFTLFFCRRRLPPC
jgi:hypothetical protein